MKKEESKPINRTALIITIVLFGIMFFLLRSCFTGDSGSYSEPSLRTLTQYEAKYIAEEQIKSLLKYPSSVEFSGVGDTRIDKIDFGYRVTGYLDSQNSFGAIVRSNYSCEVIVDTSTNKIIYRNIDIQEAI